MMALVLAVVLAAPSAALPSAHFNRAQKLFAQGHYREALDEFTAASESAPREVPDLWFDIAQCHRNLGNSRQAVAAFRRYLSLKPDAADRARVVVLIERLGGSTDDLPEAAPPASSNPNLFASLSPRPRAEDTLPRLGTDPLAGESPSPPASTIPAPSDTPVAPAHAEAPASASVALIPTQPDPPPKKHRRTWPIWVGVAAGAVAIAAVGIGVGVAYGSPSHAAVMPPMMGGSPNLGTNVTIDTRGH